MDNEFMSVLNLLQETNENLNHQVKVKNSIDDLQGFIKNNVINDNYKINLNKILPLLVMPEDVFQSIVKLRSYIINFQVNKESLHNDINHNTTTTIILDKKLSQKSKRRNINSNVKKISSNIISKEGLIISLFIKYPNVKFNTSSIVAEIKGLKASKVISHLQYLYKIGKIQRVSRGYYILNKVNSNINNNNTTTKIKNEIV